jgi:ABC-2 type transport system permease protein
VKVARDTLLIFQRQMLLLWRVPVWIAFGFAQPVTYLLLFAPVLRLALKAEGVTNYTAAYQIYVPGLLTAMALFSGLYSGYGLLAEIRSGVIERGWVTPISRVAMMLGRAMRDVVNLLVNSVIIVLFSLLLGLRVTVAAVLIGLVLLALFALGSTMLGYALTMWAKREGTVGTVLNTVSMPLSLLAGQLVPLTLAPLWLLWVARINPFYWVTSGMRDLYTDHLTAAPIWWGLVVGVALSVLTVTWAVHMFARTVR